MRIRWYLALMLIIVGAGDTVHALGNAPRTLLSWCSILR